MKTEKRWLRKRKKRCLTTSLKGFCLHFLVNMAKLVINISADVMVESNKYRRVYRPAENSTSVIISHIG